MINSRSVIGLALVVTLCGVRTASAQDPVLSELYGRGVHGYFSGRSGQASQDLSSAINLGSRDPRVYYFRGLATGNDADLRMGAILEHADSGTYPIGKSLERVQGSMRRTIESYRAAARAGTLQLPYVNEWAGYQDLPMDMMQGSVMPGSVIPGGVIPGTIMPGTVMPGTVMPGTVMPGTVIPGTVTPRTVVPGTVAPGTVTPSMPPTTRVAPSTPPARTPAPRTTTPPPVPGDPFGETLTTPAPVIPGTPVPDVAPGVPGVILPVPGRQPPDDPFAEPPARQPTRPTTPPPADDPFADDT